MGCTVGVENSVVGDDSSNHQQRNNNNDGGGATIISPVAAAINGAAQTADAKAAEAKAAAADAAASTNKNPFIRVLHFNDVYNCFPKSSNDPNAVVGGAARFIALCDSYRQGGSRYDPKFGPPLVLFSGDAFFPSLESQHTLGKHMCPIVAAIAPAAICAGNHEFDAGIERLETLMSLSGPAPWLLANVKFTDGSMLAKGLTEHCVITHNGFKIGIIGVAEREWVDTLTCIDSDEVQFEEPDVCITRVSNLLLRDGDGAGGSNNNGNKADFVIVLSHMREKRDRMLLETKAASVISLLLGGHDHGYVADVINGRQLVKSGTDFQDLSVIDMMVVPWQKQQQQQQDTSEGGGRILPDVKVLRVERVKVIKSMPECQKTVNGPLKVLKDQMEQRLTKIIGRIGPNPLDARFNIIRTQESNISNFVADTIKWNCRITNRDGAPGTSPADIVLFNCGTLRYDDIIPANSDITVGCLTRLLPMLDPLACILVTGAQLLAALENGVSQVPEHEGRFPAVSGVRFAYNATLPRGARVVPGSVVVGSDPLDLRKSYTLVTKEYLSSAGKDGYSMFPECEVIQDSETLPSLATCVQRYLLCQQMAERLQNATGFEAHKKKQQGAVKALARRWLDNKNDAKRQLRLQKNASVGEIASAAAQHNCATSDDDDMNGAGVTAADVMVGKPMPPTPFVKKIFAIKPTVDGRILEVSGMFSKKE